MCALASIETRRRGRTLLVRLLGHAGVRLTSTFWCGVLLPDGYSYIYRREALGASLTRPSLGSPFGGFVWITSTGLPIFFTFLKLVGNTIVVIIKSVWSRSFVSVYTIRTYVRTYPYMYVFKYSIYIHEYD
jgi:hypothetical protein